MAKNLIFTCPKCQSHRLECCESGPYVSEVTALNDDGDFDYGSIIAGGDVDRFQCLDCGFVLWEDSHAIDQNDEAVDWIKTNCPQPE